jgi:hypothetical protein
MSHGLYGTAASLVNRVTVLVKDLGLKTQYKWQVTQVHGRWPKQPLGVVVDTVLQKQVCGSH